MSLVRSAPEGLLSLVKRTARAGIGRMPGKRVLFELARRLPLPLSLTRRVPFEGPFRVALGGGAKFEVVGHGLPSENELFWGGFARHEERESLRLWMRLCRAAGVIVDVGAHLGIYALSAAAVNPEALVFGFEPNERAFGLFRANCARSRSGVRAVPTALGDRDGVTDLFFDEDLATASLGRPEGREKARVPIRTLKGFLEEQGLSRVDLLKVDVETFEPAVVAGLGDLLERSRPTMIVEVLSDDVGRELERLCPPGYEYFHIDERRGPSRRERLVRVSHESRNYLLCPPASAAASELP